MILMPVYIVLLYKLIFRHVFVVLLYIEHLLVDLIFEAYTV